MKQSTWWTIGGVLALIAGTLALIYPVVSSFAAEIFVAWAFIVLGVFTIFTAFNLSGTGEKVVNIIFGVLVIWLGFAMLANPLAGVMSLTIAVAATLFVMGLVKFFMSFRLWGNNSFWLVMLSAVMSIALGVMIMMDYPATASYILGMFLGIELIFDGVALIGLGMAGKDLEDYIREGMPKAENV